MTSYFWRSKTMNLDGYKRKAKNITRLIKQTEKRRKEEGLKPYLERDTGLLQDLIYKLERLKKANNRCNGKVKSLQNAIRKKTRK